MQLFLASLGKYWEIYNYGVVQTEFQQRSLGVPEGAGSGGLPNRDVGHVHRFDLAGADYFEPAGRHQVAGNS